MKPTETPKVEPDEGRREALKRFGKLAAAAPATMLLLQSRRSNAAECTTAY